MASKGAYQCVCAAVCIILVFFIVLLSASIKSLEINTYGLNYNPISKKIEDKVYKSGIHWLGFTHSFLEYPQQLQTLNFGNIEGAKGDVDRGLIQARSIDGLTITFRASFQYQLEESGIYKLYMKYGEDYKSPCIRLAVDSMSDQAAKFNASSFFKNLAGIGTEMQSTLRVLFQKECYARIQALQLSKAVLPRQYEAALEATNIVIQESITQQQRQQNIIVDMQTLQNQARIEAPIVVNNAKAYQEASEERNQASVNAMVAVTQQTTESYKKILNDQFGGDQTKFLEFYKAQTVMNYNSKNLLMGIDSKQNNGI